MALSTEAIKFLEALTQRSSQVVFAYELSSNRFLLLNAAFAQLWGKQPERVLRNASSLLDTIHPEDLEHVQQAYAGLLAGEATTQLEFRILPENAPSEKWLCVTPFLLAEEQVLVGYGQDITEQRQYNDTLKKHSDKKNSILNILAHDLAAPLAMIQGLAAMLEEDLQFVQNQQIHETIKMIESSSKQGIALIQDFIQQEFLESATVMLIKRRVNLVEAIREIIDEYQQTEQLTKKTFHYHTSSNSIYLELDDNKFMQVINNLTSNAIKFTPDGGEITIALEEKEDTVLIKVADTGVGIPGKYHATLFDKFTNARRPGLKGEPSVGLGMSIIKTIVEWHQGHIWLESQENKGTAFYIELPKS